MADELSLEQVKELEAAYTRLKSLIEGGANITLIKDQLNSMGGGFSKLSDSTVKATKNLSDLTKQSSDFVKVGLDEATDGLGDSFEALKEKVKNSSDEMGLFLGKMLMLSPIATRRLPLPDAFDAIGKSAKGATGSIADMLKTTMNLFNTDFSSNSKLKAGFSILGANAERADFAKNYETGLLQSAAATGDFSEVLKSVGSDLSGLSLRTEAYSDLVVNVGNASGLSSKQVAEYASQLRVIPGALDNFKDGSGKAVADMHYLDAAIKTSVGTGQDFSTVISDLSFQFETLGTKGAPALELVSRMQSASDTLNMPLEKIRDYVRTSAEAFKFLGDNAQGAINIMGELGPSLRRSGLGPSAINELVKGVTSGISQMSTAQKAFLSAQTGGSGGLQGSFQIDLMLRQGKIDEVFNKVGQNLKQQLGGTIVSLEDAAKDSGAAAQFQRQLALVKSPAMGGIAKTDNQAMRILEALAGKEKGDVANLKSPEAAFKDAMGVGDKLQDRQNNLLVQANNWAERQAQIQSIIAYNTSRSLIGSESGGLAQYLRSNKMMAGQDAKDLNILTGTGTGGGQNVDQRLKETYAKMEDFAGTVKDKLTKAVEAQTEIPKEKDGVQVRADGMVDNRPIPKINQLSPPPNMVQYASANVDQTQQVIEQQNMRGEQQKNNNQQQQQNKESNVNVSLTCPQCQKMNTIKAAQDVVGHYHGATEQSYIHGLQSAF
jgi:hypothetical protein